MAHTSIFIVRSPLQLFNCVEAGKRYDDCGIKVLLILFRKEVDRALMEKIVTDADAVWGEVIFGDIRSNLKQIKLVLTLFRRYMDVKYCFIGDSTHIFNVYLNSIKPDKVVIVDDGASTYQRALMVITGKYQVQNRHHEAIPALLRVTDRLLRLGPTYFKDASFFSMYKTIQAYSERLDLVHNDYRFYRERVVNLPVKNEILFIGSDIRRYVLSDPEKFEFYLSAVAKHYAGKQWTYVLHRKENESREKRSYMDAMARKYSFKIDIYDKILEQQILHQGWKPEEIATFWSSAIDTLNVIYNPSATVFKLRAEDVKETSRFALQEMHRHYGEMNLRIVEV